MIKLIGLKQLIENLGLKRSTIYEMINAGQFPEPIQIGERRVAWRESEIEKWVISRPRGLRPQKAKK